jgi:hypothetical protein
MTTFQIPRHERIKLVGQETISEMALIPPLSNLESYRAELLTIPETGVNVLDQEVKSTGAPNLHNIAYTEISKLYLRDAVHILFSHPKVYLTSLRQSFLIFFFPTNDYFPWTGNRAEILFLDRIYNVVFSGQICPAEPTILYRYDTQRFCNMGLFLFISYIAVVIYSPYLVIRDYLVEANLPVALTVLFLWINVIYVTGVSNAFEIGENNRFRFIITPLLLVLFSRFLEQVSSKLHEWFHR